MSGWLDRLPAPVRHLLFSAAAILALAGINYAQSTYTTWGLSPAIEAVLACLIPLIIAYVTPWTAQYGVGSSVLPLPSADVSASQDTGA